MLLPPDATVLLDPPRRSPFPFQTSPGGSANAKTLVNPIDPPRYEGDLVRKSRLLPWVSRRHCRPADFRPLAPSQCNVCRPSCCHLRFLLPPPVLILFRFFPSRRVVDPHRRRLPTRDAQRPTANAVRRETTSRADTGGVCAAGWERVRCGIHRAGERRGAESRMSGGGWKGSGWGEGAWSGEFGFF